MYVYNIRFEDLDNELKRKLLEKIEENIEISKEYKKIVKDYKPLQKANIVQKINR